MSDKQYIKGFNHGYWLKKNEPKIYDRFFKGLVGDSVYKNGIKDGAGQFEKERTQTQIKDRMKGREQKGRKGGR